MSSMRRNRVPRPISRTRIPAVPGYHHHVSSSPSTPVIRAPHADELPLLRDVERAAGALFAEVGMVEVAEDEPFPVEVLARYRAAGRLWVVVDAADVPVGYLVADPVDGNVHIEQVSVHPAASRRGLGAALIEHVAAWATARGTPALTLTTFRDLPWNAPYYRRLGFRVLPARRQGPRLRAVRAHETAAGLDRWPRVCMIRDLAREPGDR